MSLNVQPAQRQRPAAKRKTRPSVSSRAAGSGQARVMSAGRAFARDDLAGDLDVTAQGHVVALTSLDKVYWPESGYTKAHLLRYYWQTARYILPYLKDRPLILKRHPDGLAGGSFFQHDVNDAPDYVRTVPLKTETGRKIDYVVCDNRATLLYLANMGAMAPNPWHSRVGHLDTPDWLVLDLDPGDVDFDVVCETALAVRAVLERLGLEAWPKTSGSRGMHVYVPLKAKTTYARAAAVAEHIAAAVAAEQPGLATLERNKQKRPAGRVYVDHLQNARGKAVAAPYAVRARPGATVSAPLAWDEVERRVRPSAFTIETMPGRLADLGDLFAPVRTRRQSINDIEV